MTPWLVGGGAIAATAIAVLLWRLAVANARADKAGRQVATLTRELADTHAAAADQALRQKGLADVVRAARDACIAGSADLVRGHLDLADEYLRGGLLEAAGGAPGAGPHAAVPGPAPATPAPRGAGGPG